MSWLFKKVLLNFQVGPTGPDSTLTQPVTYFQKFDDAGEYKHKYARSSCAQIPSESYNTPHLAPLPTFYKSTQTRSDHGLLS